MGIFDLFKTSKQECNLSNPFSKYKILTIKSLDEDLYGKTVIIEANPLIQSNYGGISVIEHQYKDIKYFIIPLDKRMVDNIVDIANSDGFWVPNITDFREETVYNEDLQQRMPVYRHKYLYK
ncbi:MAG: hypothetical protein ACLRYI_12190 [Bacteroides uniformis]